MCVPTLSPTPDTEGTDQHWPSRVAVSLFELSQVHVAQLLHLTFVGGLSLYACMLQMGHAGFVSTGTKVNKIVARHSCREQRCMPGIPVAYAAGVLSKRSCAVLWIFAPYSMCRNGHHIPTKLLIRLECRGSSVGQISGWDVCLCSLCCVFVEHLVSMYGL